MTARSGGRILIDRLPTRIPRRHFDSRRGNARADTFAAARRVGFAAAALVVSSCGPPLGTHQVREARLVPGSALEQVDPGEGWTPGPRLLRLEFTSATDLAEASGDNQLYLWASFCPYDEARRLRTYGPFFDDRSLYGPVRTVSRRVKPDGREIRVVHSEDRRPERDPRSGQFVYTGYLELNGPGYDLQRQIADLCLRIDHPGYFLTRSRSRVFQVPARMVRSALLRSASARLQLRP